PSRELVVGNGHDVLQTRRTDRDSHEAIEAESIACGRRHALFECGHEAFVDRIHGLARECTGALICLEASALLDGVRQLTEAVAELDAARIKLESLGK